jgi:hypothetical protein
MFRGKPWDVVRQFAGGRRSATFSVTKQIDLQFFILLLLRFLNEAHCKK